MNERSTLRQWLLEMKEYSGLWLEVWTRHRGVLHGEPQHVDDDLLAAAVRADPNIPKGLAEMVAARIDGTDSRPRGRPRKPPEDMGHRMASALGLRIDVDRRRAAFRIQGLSPPTELAIEAIAKEKGLRPYTVKNRLRRDRKDFPDLVGGRRPDRSEFVQAVVDEGFGRLDPVLGLVLFDPPPEDA